MSETKDGGNSSKSMDVKYKYRDIKVYSSNEWMANSTKKYRRVYDRYETTFMRVEFSFFNKLFDEADWEANLRFKCFHLNGSQKNELCNLELKRPISKDENIVYARHSWGNQTPGAYWFKGEYSWECYIDEVKVGESKFYVEDVGETREGENLYFDIDSIKLFEGDGQASGLKEKKYLNTFSQSESRYIWSEFKFQNKAKVGYYAEILFNFYSDSGQLKGTHDYLTYVSPNTAGQIYTIFPGWGSETPGNWSNDTYTMEVVFMDNLLATVYFTVADKAVEGDIKIKKDSGDIFKAVGDGAQSGGEQTHEDLLHESLAELNALTGLESIKQEVNEMVQLVKFYQETGKDVLSKFSLHTVFTGNPGTGKTTVARLLSKVYKGLGILEKGHLVEVDREGLVAGYVGQTAIKTAEKVNEAMGGILFIDEAYALAQGKGSNYDFGGEAIAAILKRMEDNRGKFGVIVAGYTENMIEFITSNPGLKSRFDKYFEFPDYTPEQMWAIAASMFKKEDVTPDEEATNHLKNFFTFIHAHRDRHFGNARTVRQVVGECVRNQHLRLASMKKEARTPEIMATIIYGDVREFQIVEVPQPKAHRIGFQTSSDEN